MYERNSPQKNLFCERNHSTSVTVLHRSWCSPKTLNNTFFFFFSWKTWSRSDRFSIATVSSHLWKQCLSAGQDTLTRPAPPRPTLHEKDLTFIRRPLMSRSNSWCWVYQRSLTVGLQPLPGAARHGGLICPLTRLLWSTWSYLPP